VEVLKICLLYIFYALLATAADVGSGIITLYPRLAAVNHRYVVALASGVVMSAAFLELLPQSNIESNAIYVALGFFTFYVIEKAMMLHACDEEECESHTMNITSVIGMASDNIVDGIGIAVAYLTDPTLGLAVTIAIVVHEIPQGIASTSIMRNAGYNLKKTFTVLAVAGFTYPVGAAIAQFIPQNIYIAIIAFIAGDFIYIGAGDLLHEAHRRFNYKVVLATLLGAAFFIAIESLI
jgi:zinc transporter ZupT